MHRSIRNTAIAIAGLALTVSAATPALAHEIRPGAKCAMSGMVHLEQGKAYVCTKSSAGKLAWGKGLTKSAGKLTIADSWTKSADKGMSAAFGKITNPGATSVKIVAALSPYATAVQLHEVVDKDGKMVMQEKPGGFTIASLGTLELKPGGNHLMFVGLKKPIAAGTMVPVTLVMSDGSQVTFKSMGKVFAGANENYDANGSESMNMSMS